ncbi:hypothetical protein LOAG_02866 [Loa loa]|uniref:Uncharacterized protein n=1 Tax=Loa loa TaxID=7209 RepID=A0A1S0U611_LOALO|nr:hypothetical protein LOAG_02866 [Loa loa]EFO25619.1 hypothetical protein LOAG_02866 [Loa loa]
MKETMERTGNEGGYCPHLFTVVGTTKRLPVGVELCNIKLFGCSKTYPKFVPNIFAELNFVSTLHRLSSCLESEFVIRMGRECVQYQYHQQQLLVGKEYVSSSMGHFYLLYFEEDVRHSCSFA